MFDLASLQRDSSLFLWMTNSLLTLIPHFYLKLSKGVRVSKMYSLYKYTNTNRVDMILSAICVNGLTI